MKFKQYADITEIIKHKFDGKRQAFADHRKVKLTQVNRWIAKNGHILNGDTDGKVFLNATIHKGKHYANS